MWHGIDKFLVLWLWLARWPAAAAAELRVLREWGELEFVFPDEAARRAALASGDYAPGPARAVPLDVDVHYDQGEEPRVFVTVPRFTSGAPVTLGTLDARGRVHPYPDYSWHERQGHNCDGMTSVFRVAMDACRRLWVMDTGKVGDTQHCAPQLLAFDLRTDQLVHRHRFHAALYTDASIFVNPVVDVRGGAADACADTFVYVADVRGFGLVVVDVAGARAWRINHRLFHPFPSRGTFTIAGESFDLMDGVMGMALTPLRPGRDRYLYFHAAAATTENLVPTSLLRNSSFLQNPDADSNAINVLASERPSQSAAQAMDGAGILYFGLMDPPSVQCWNTATQFSPRNFHTIDDNRETLQFASGVKVVDNLDGEQELWVLTCSFQKVATGSINANETNFRILAEGIPALLQGSPCARPEAPCSDGYHEKRYRVYIL